ncbi:hypothetical protein [Actinomadura flavalba]|uniref:hypothetical protein n=1 Tax=Actinomadura flavalba TaxID=1120938 RepID=UPI00036CAAC4|nr:hypothetical protein [Actinomadura flavalba]
MGVAALLAWSVTAAVGAYLLTRWWGRGGLRRQATKVTRYPLLLLTAHPFTALTGLCAWVVHLLGGHPAFAWVAFGLLVLVAFQGFLLFTRWLVGRGGRHARGTEDGFPRAAVLTHGLLAAVTFVLVFATALRMGR